MSAMASTINFKCDFSDDTYVNEFSLVAKNVTVNDGKFENVKFDFTLRKSGRDSLQEKLAVTRDGTYEVIPAGTIYNHEVSSLVSVVKGADVEYINLFIDATPFYTSAIRLLDGQMYYGTCKSL